MHAAGAGVTTKPTPKPHGIGSAGRNFTDIPHYDIDKYPGDGYEYSWFLGENSLSCLDVCASQGMRCSSASEARMKAASASNQETFQESLGDDFSRFCQLNLTLWSTLTDKVNTSLPFVNTSTGVCFFSHLSTPQCRGTNEEVQRLCYCEGNSDYSNFFNASLVEQRHGGRHGRRPQHQQPEALAVPGMMRREGV